MRMILTSRDEQKKMIVFLTGERVIKGKIASDYQENYREGSIPGSSTLTDVETSDVVEDASDRS
jgi:hypothetical protein